MTGSRTRRDATANRDRIMSVGRSMTDDGIELALNEVARRAEVGVATVYRHFPTPEALLEAIATPGLQRLVDIGKDDHPTGDPGADLDEFLRQVVREQMRDASMAPVIAAPVDQLPATTELKGRLIATGTELLHRAQQAGVVRDDIDETDMVPLVCGIAHAVGVRHGSDAAEVADRYLEVMLKGLRRG